MDHRYNLEAWAALEKVGEKGSFSGAAEALSVETSTVSRLISHLEHALGRELVNRATKPIELTPDGREAVNGMRPVLRAHRNFLAKVTSESASMSGRIRLAVAGGLLNSKLMPILMDFRRLYPHIDFDVQMGRMVHECLNGTIDVASVSGEVQEEGLVKLPRGRSVFIPVASPAYIARCGFPHSPDDLRHHTGFVYTGPVRPPTTELVRGEEIRPIRWESSFQTTDILMVKKAVLDGLGVAADLPLLHCAREIASGSLVVILDGWHRVPIPAYTVCSNAAWHIRRNRIFMNWWSERFLRAFAETERLARAALGERALMYLQEDGQG